MITTSQIITSEGVSSIHIDVMFAERGTYLLIKQGANVIVVPVAVADELSMAVDDALDDAQVPAMKIVRTVDHVAMEHA